MLRRASSPGNGRKPQWLRVGLLSLLAIATVIVVVIAATSTRDASPNAGTVPSISMMTPQPEATPEAEPEPAPVPAFVSPIAQRILAIDPSDSDHLIRAWVGQCPDPAGSLEVSFDGGETWDAGVISSVDARRMLHVEATGDLVRMVAQTAACTPEVARSFVGGTSWELDPDQTSVWYVEPTDSTLVYGPTGQSSLPCQVVGLSTEGSRGVALCSDSTAFTSEDGGAAWSGPVAAPNAVAVGAVAEGFVVTSHGEPDCAGVRTRFLNAGALSDPGACLEVAGAENGNTAIAGGPDGWLLWAGDAMLRSSDLGTTWR